MLGALRKKQFTASFLEHFKGNHENTIYNLKITNTFFKHKPIHLTTWQSPAPYLNITDCKTNTPRRSAFRNQLDYILVRNNTNAKVFNSKATIFTTTNSDHKPVITKIMIKWKYQSKTKSCKKRFNMHYMKNQNNKNSYQNDIKSYLIDNHDQPSYNQNLLEQNYQNVESSCRKYHRLCK